MEIVMHCRIMEQSTQKLEGGSIYFFYRSFTDEDDCCCASDIQRFFMILNPAGRRQYRVAMLGKKKPRRRRPESPNMWGIVRRIAATPEQIEIEIDARNYHTKSRHERQLKAPRPVGHGLYHIVQRQDDTHLVYSLDVPLKPSEFVPKNFAIAPEADYILKIKNPDRPFPPGFGIEQQEVQYPRQLQKFFENKPFLTGDPTELLSYEGTGLLLTSVDAVMAEETDTQERYDDESQTPQNFIDDLRQEKTQYRIEPLFAGSRI